MRAVVLGVCVWLATAAAAWAQFDTATVLGTVRDSSEAVVPGAKVTLTAVETGISAVKVSGVDGNYEFAAVRPGLYVVTSEKNGFAVALVDGVQVQVGARLRVDLRMSVGQLSEKVEVSSSQPLVETDSSQRGQVISGEQIRALPLVSREYSSLALLTTGVKLAGSSLTTGNTPREGAFNVNGLRSTVNNFLIDGIDNNAYGTSNQGFSNQVMQPPPDAITEFKVVTNNMSAEYGRAAGATINVNYRSGTNTIHGTAWEFLRDTSMNATGYFKPPTGKPTLDRHQFGGVFGGPLVRNKAFVFGDYEGLRQTRRSTGFATIATPTQRQGILTVDVRDPRSGVTYPAGTAIPMTDFARKVLAGLPDSNVAGTTNNYTTLQEFTADSNKGGVKVDVQFSPAAAMFARYGMRNLTTDDQPNIPLPSGGAGNGHIYARNRQFVLGSTWTPTAQSLLETRFGYSWTQAGKNPPALGSGSAQDQFGIPGLPTDPRIAGGLPTQLITGYSDLGRQATNPQWQYPTVYNPKINYTWLAGAHSLKSGYEFQHILTEVQDVNPLYGRDTYNGQFSRPAGIASNNLYNLADFMLGLRAQYALSSVLVANLIRNMHFAYVQDDWRVGSNLTLNLGLRYEFSTPYWEKDNVLSNFDPANNRMILATDGSISDRALINPDRNNFGPRLGFAYTMTPRTVVRGGYGISYVHFSRAGGGDVLPINGPQVVNAVVNQTVPSAPTFVPAEQGYPAGLADPSQFNPLTANITYMPDDFHSSPVQSWHISIQRELMRNMLIDVAYIGNRGDDLLLFANYNQANPNNAAGTIPLQDRRPNPAFADITYAFNGGKSRYKALQAKWEWRVSRDVTLLNSLTLSEAKDNGAQSLENSNGNFPAPQDFRNMEADFGLSNYHQPYNNTTSFVWALPFGEGKRWLSSPSPLVNALVGGWELAGHPLALRRRAGDLHLHARRDVRRLRHRPGFPRRQQLSAERDLRSDGDGRGADHQQLVQPRLRVGAHRPEPAVRQRGAQLRARAEILVAGLRRLEARPARRPGTVRVAHRGVQRAEQDELPRAQWQPERRRRSAPSPRPSIRASCSSGSRCCGRARDDRGGGAGTARATTRNADPHRAPRRQRPSARAHARGLSPGRRDGCGLHRARSRLDERRRADRPPRERDRRHHRRRGAVSRSQADEGDRRAIDRRMVQRGFHARGDPDAARARAPGVPIPCLRRQVPDRDLRRSDRAGPAPRRGARPACRRLSRDEASDLLPQHRPAARREAGRVAGEARMESRRRSRIHSVVRAGESARAAQEDPSAADSARQRREAGERRRAEVDCRLCERDRAREKPGAARQRRRLARNAHRARGARPSSRPAGPRLDAACRQGVPARGLQGRRGGGVP